MEYEIYFVWYLKLIVGYTMCYVNLVKAVIILNEYQSILGAVF